MEPDELQELQRQICCQSTKLHHLEQSFEIEKQEKKRIEAAKIEREKKYREIKERNDALCRKSSQQVNFEKDEAVTRSKVSQMMSSDSIEPVKEVMLDFEGI